jgi:hypothetical protein
VDSPDDNRKRENEDELHTVTVTETWMMLTKTRTVTVQVAATDEKKAAKRAAPKAAEKASPKSKVRKTTRVVMDIVSDSEDQTGDPDDIIINDDAVEEDGGRDIDVDSDDDSEAGDPDDITIKDDVDNSPKKAKAKAPPFALGSTPASSTPAVDSRAAPSGGFTWAAPSSTFQFGRTAPAAPAKRQKTTKSQSPGPPSMPRQTYSGPPDEPIEGGWPAGWTKIIVPRKSGAKTPDKYWYSPIKQLKFRSLVEVKRFMAALATCNGDETEAQARQPAAAAAPAPEEPVFFDLTNDDGVPTTATDRT